MELNRDQIVKALECCSENEDCAHCPCLGNCKCINSLLRDALALIRELTEENERLIAESAKEFTCAFASPHKVADCPLPDEVAKAKADTVRKMQERLNQSIAGFSDSFRYFADELLEETK